MRRLLALAILLTLAACGGPQQSEVKRESSDLKTFDVAEAPPPAPGIGPSNAPGVAFNYRYAFRLPGNRIAAVQEQHAQACERLGLARCRITGMRYRLVNETDVEGMLAFKLEPGIARRFGKAGIEAVSRAEGLLVDSEISGEDAEFAIQQADQQETKLRSELTRIEQQLARAGLPAMERDRLRAEEQQLRQSIRANDAERDERRQSLATTPVTFEYGSGDLVPGFDTHSPMRAALEQAGDNFIGSIAILFVFMVSILPWLALLLLLFWLYRRWTARRPALLRPSTTELSPGEPALPADRA